MNEQQYQAAIPHICKLKTIQEHIDVLGLCWSITNGYVHQQGQGRGNEGPSFCQTCKISVRAKRLEKK